MEWKRQSFKHLIEWLKGQSFKHLIEWLKEILLYIFLYAVFATILMIVSLGILLMDVAPSLIVVALIHIIALLLVVLVYEGFSDHRRGRGGPV